ncbi:MAG TPA: DUF1015 domain-containing protein [Treponemataceae bacterium]|nr:DUF1015 domain-containing protein [Treponemataceae bacterium]
MDAINKHGLQTPNILLPHDNGMLTKWPVVACDQYTQDKAYWEKAADIVGENPSTLHLILPEVYLEDTSKATRIEKIRATMEKYLSSTVFKKPLLSMIYLERKTAYGRTRKGLITCVDLDCYEWRPFSHAKIRATEATIIDRIPPRIKIRHGAQIECPHIMLLVNDPDKSLVEKTGKLSKKSGKELYNIDLMIDAGNITGWKADNNNSDIQKNIIASLELIKKNNTDESGTPFMFAVGDGNHSLATAKAIWDEYKEKKQVQDHPSRYALVEIVNIYDDGLTFEPIHRVLYNVNQSSLINYIQEKLAATKTEYSTATELENNIKNSKTSFGFVHTDKNNTCHYTCLETSITDLAVSILQPLIDDFLKEKTLSKENPRIDYIHGSDEVFRLGEKTNAITILLPPIAKESFFHTIAHTGPLPRKSFSMGEASEKRFYMECRKLF